tara:strand:+ start:2078 stop:2509 length:432 start_codon:yes stop_codon:yes gene_type:complete
MADKEKYRPGSFQKKYIAKCFKIGEPLSNKQVNVLEKIIQNTFGYKILENEQPDILREEIPIRKHTADFSFERVSVRVYNRIWRYLDRFKQITDRTPTNEDALEFYELYKNGLKKRDRQEIFRGFGETSFRELKKYLENKKII